MITCLTPPISDADSPATVLVKFDDDVTRKLTSQVFTYYENPVVDDVTPRKSYRRLFIIINITDTNIININYINSTGKCIILITFSEY